VEVGGTLVAVMVMGMEMSAAALPIVFASVAALLLGIIVTALLARARHAGLLAAANERAADLAARLEERSLRVADLERRVEDAMTEVAARRAEEARLESSLASERTASAEKLALVQTAETALRDAFQALSAKALHDNNEAFLSLARSALGEVQQRAAGDLELRKAAIDELVKPIRESLDRVGAQLKTVETDRVGAYASLQEQVRGLAETQQQLHGETVNLVRALRTPSVRGRWGEMQLRRVVELAGMLPHVDFLEQQTVATEDGRRRPDLVVQLPGERQIVVDAKAPLLAYLDALEATDDALRDANMKAHARQVRDHVASLSNRSYWAQFQTTPELVIMFLPAESFLNAALQHDPTLMEFAADKRVILASPPSLIGLLYAVAHGWQQHSAAERALELSRLGRALYDRLRTMLGHFEKLRGALDGATAAYNQAMGSFESRVLVSARRIKDFSATATAPELPLLEPIDRAARHVDISDQLDLDDAASALEPLES
jgi:DNA recombination protein RmuC